MPKKNKFDWGAKYSDDTVHHESWPWDYDDEPIKFEDDHPDERYGADDYFSSRPWKDDD